MSLVQPWFKEHIKRLHLHVNKRVDGWVKRGGKLLNPAVKMCLSVTLQFKHPYLVALSLMDASSIHSQTCAQRCERLPHGYVPTRFLNDLIGPCMSHSYAFPTFNEMVHFLSSGWYFAFLAASPLLLWFSLLGNLCLWLLTCLVPLQCPGLGSDSPFTEAFLPALHS